MHCNCSDRQFDARPREFAVGGSVRAVARGVGTDQAPQDCEGLGPDLGPEAAGDPLLDLQWPQILLRHVVRGRDSGVAEKPKGLRPVVAQADGEIAALPPLRPALAFRMQGRKCLVVFNTVVGQEIVVVLEFGGPPFCRPSAPRRHDRFQKVVA